MAETDAGWIVRIERQLTCPAEVAWDLWFGVDLTTGEQRTAPDIGEPLTPYMAPEVVRGTVTELERHRVLAFDVAPTGGPGDHVRVELGPGTGHGARLTLTVSGTDPDPGQTLTWTATGLPAGLTIGPSTGTIRARLVSGSAAPSASGRRN